MFYSKYLQLRLHRIISLPNTLPYIYYNFQIALESVCVIDDGETMLVEGLRVAAQERGKGVARVLLRFCSQFVKSNYPEVKVTRLTRDDQLGPKDFQKYRIISKQVIFKNIHRTWNNMRWKDRCYTWQYTWQYKSNINQTYIL